MLKISRKGLAMMLAASCFSAWLPMAQVALAQGRESAQEGEVVSARQVEPALNDLFVHQWLTLGEGRSIRGSINEITGMDASRIAEADISLVRNGLVEYFGKADSNGEFQLMGIEPGTYSLVAGSKGALAAFSVTILSAENGKHLSNEIEVRCVRPVGEKVHEIVRSQVLPPFLTRLDGAESSLSVDPLADHRQFAKSYIVRSDDEGNFVGQLSMAGSLGAKDLSDMTVFVVQDGKEIARTSAKANGEFDFTGIEPGNYGLVAAGPSGFVALGFQLANPAVANLRPDGERYVAMVNKLGCRRMHCEVIQTCDVPVCEPICTVEEVIVQEPMVTEVVAAPCDMGCAPEPVCGCPCGGGMMGGGFGFGGGGGGGGGGLGGLGGGGGILAAAGLAGVAAAIANDDDNFNFNPPPNNSDPNP